MVCDHTRLLFLSLHLYFINCVKQWYNIGQIAAWNITQPTTVTQKPTGRNEKWENHQHFGWNFKILWIFINPLKIWMNFMQMKMKFHANENEIPCKWKWNSQYHYYRIFVATGDGPSVVKPGGDNTAGLQPVEMTMAITSSTCYERTNHY